MSQGNDSRPEPHGRRFALHSERTEAGERISLLGEMDLSVIGQVDREVRRAEDGDAARIVLDLDELEFVDASGIRLLLNLSDRSRSNGGRLRITRARYPQVRRVIELTGVGDVLPFWD
ncbi:MAG TPA: STAS domain-containing protein [Solirubrobacterales bacterium]|nr:STAS domain-containing protein [Solirubrobacterales bacterium]